LVLEKKKQAEKELENMVKDLKEKLDKYDNEKKSVVKMEKAKRDNALLKHEQVSLKITICHIDKNDCHG